MFKVILFFLAISCPLFGGGTVCLNMIVKNEKAIIERCLESTLPLIDYWVIVDTGSTDGTQEIIKKFMKKKGVRGELHERPWVNFEHNRNEALELAKNKADYSIFIDADDRFTYTTDFKKPNFVLDYYMIPISFGGLKYHRIHLVKNSLPWQWAGVVHEVLQANVNWTTATLEGVTNLCSVEGDRAKDPLKYQKDAKLLEEALKKNPNHTRNVFYLAQSYRDYGNNEKAIEVYNKRVALGGWDEEVYCSLFQIGVIQERMGLPPDEIIASYRKAYCFRKSRAEALVHMARLYRLKGDCLTGYLIAKHAYELPPSQDLLFVEQSLIENDLPLELSVCAYWAGYHDEFARLTRSLMQKSSLPSHVKAIVEKNAPFLEVPARL